jgi:ribosome-associated translation inhibitor RaiA
MHIRIFDGPIKTSNAEFQYVLDRVGRVMGGALSERAEIAVRLSDVNGPRGGLDKRCSIQFTDARRLTLSVEERARSYYGAIDAAAAKLGRALVKALERSTPRARRARSRGARGA